MDKILENIAATSDSGNVALLSQNIAHIMNYKDESSERERRDRLVMFAALRKALRKASIPVKGDGWPQRNVLPPRGSGLHTPGADPADIKDPVLRRQYEESIQRNNERAEHVGERSQAALLLLTADRTMVAYAAAAYGDSKEERSALEMDAVALENRSEFIKSVTQWKNQTHKGK